MKRERVFIVDENDNIIGEKWRDEMTDDDCWRVISIWITDQDGNILLQQRSFKKDLDPGDWSAAAEGTVGKNDEYEATAIRELNEELGISCATLKPTTKVHHRMASKGYRIRQGYLCAIDHIPEKKINIQKSEVEQVKWFTPTEFKAFAKKENISLIDIYKQLGFIS